MKHLHRRVIITGIVCAALIGVAWALLGIGGAAIIAVGLFAVCGLILAGIVVFEEESRYAWWKDAENTESDHGYHPAR